VPTIVGGLILLLGGWYVVEGVCFIAGTETASGVVVEHKFTHSLDKRHRAVETAGYQTKTTDMYAPVVEFESPRGRKIRFQPNWSEGEPLPVGTEVGVRFADQNPEDARVAGVSPLFGGAAIVLLLGGLIGSAGLLSIRKGTKSKAPLHPCILRARAGPNTRGVLAVYPDWEQGARATQPPRW
jgi:hypothetical protein